MFSFNISNDISSGSSLNLLVTSLKDVPERLASRLEVEPEEFVKTLTAREITHNKNNYSPSCSENELFPGTYYLTNVDEKFRRTYQRTVDESSKEGYMVVWIEQTANLENGYSVRLVGFLSYSLFEWLRWQVLTSIVHFYFMSLWKIEL